MRVPGKASGIRPSAKPTTPAIEAPVMEEWEHEAMLPSLLLLGPSGSGKTNGIAQLCAAGFKVAFVEIEPKAFSVGKHRPLHINLCKPIDGRPPTAIERYLRMRELQEQLRAGQYRTAPDGTPIDILAFDGLTEVADLIYAHKCQQYSKSQSMDLWTGVGKETIQFFRDCRDAAGVASSRLGLPPVGIVATCGEATAKKLDVTSGKSRIERDQPLLQGQMALPRLPFLFEIVWRLDAGEDAGAHQWRVHTQLGETYFAKSPGGLYPPCVTGPGGVGNDPDIGKMYMELLTNEASPYLQPERVK